MKRRVIIAIIILAVAASFVLAMALRPKRSPGSIRLSGNIEVTDVDVSFRTPGRILERKISEGELVRRNDLVARLDETELRQQLAQREAESGAARAVLRELEAGTRPQEIAVARAALRAAEADVERMNKEFERQKALYAEGLISGHDYDATSAGTKSASEHAEQARQQLKLAQEGPRREEIDAARARAASADEALANARTRLSYAVLVAPANGFVLAHHAEAGEDVVAGAPIITIGDLDHPWLRAYLSESDLGRVHLGEAARVTTDGRPGKVYRGRVGFISPEAEFTPKSVQTEEERVKLVYRVKIYVENPGYDLKPGMPADAVIEAK
jgi:HlyD family secretion protein